MTIRVLVNGAFGKMGQEVVKVLQQDVDLKLVGQTGKTDDLTATIIQAQADVVVDFTNPLVAFKNALTILNAGSRLVLGTTGITPDQVQELSDICKKQRRGAVIAPNFSIGAVLMMQFAQQCARHYSDVEIIELHHPGKMDAPSGTALKTAEMIAKENQQVKMATKPVKETIPGSRGASSHGIPIHAIRLPGIVANQEIIFGGMGETLRICHNTIHREAFMPGVLLACKKVMKLDHLVYGLENLL